MCGSYKEITSSVDRHVHHTFIFKSLSEIVNIIVTNFENVLITSSVDRHVHHTFIFKSLSEIVNINS